MDSIPEIYKEVMTAWYNVDSTLKFDWGIHILNLNDKNFFWSLDEAFKNLVKGGVFVTSPKGTYFPTEMGKVLIENVVGKKRNVVPKFIPPEKWKPKE